jgi:D-psicose/D-tagatose/L-ribulose 3-epimerase
MKAAIDLLLWTATVEEKHWPTIERLQAAGFDGVEIPVFTGSPDDYAAIGRRLDGLGLGRTALTVIPTPQQNPLSAEAGERRAAVQYLNWAIDCTAALGAGILCGPLHSTLGHFTGQPLTEAERARMVEFHHAIGGHAERQGVTIAVEALNRFECYAITTQAELAAHLTAVAHPAVKGMYDTFHAHIEEKDPAAAIRTIAPHLVHVHVSENDRGTPGKGQVPWAATFAALKAAGYDGWLTIEAFGRALPELAAATKVWRDFFPDPDEVWQVGQRTIRDGWAAA